MADLSAAVSFGTSAADYDRVRPAVTPEALQWLLHGLKTEHVLDLGAGTGALSRSLHAAGYRVTAVDPDERMLAVLRETSPQVSTAVGSAEAVPLPDDSVDAVLVSSAWHWFDQRRAPYEIARVLRGGGRLGTVGTLLDPQVPWVATLYDRLVVSAGRPRPWDLPQAPSEGPFTAIERTEFAWSVAATVQEVVHLVGTWSPVARVDDAARKAELLRWASGVIHDANAAGDGAVRMPFRSYCVRCDFEG